MKNQTRKILALLSSILLMVFIGVAIYYLNQGKDANTPKKDANTPKSELTPSEKSHREAQNKLLNKIDDFEKDIVQGIATETEYPEYARTEFEKVRGLIISGYAKDGDQLITERDGKCYIREIKEAVEDAYKERYEKEKNAYDASASWISKLCYPYTAPGGETEAFELVLSEALPNPV
ncbi:MAG: hypothetical protein ACPGC9_00395 [Cytophagales bacterium]